MSFYLQNLASRQPLPPAWVERPWRRNLAGHEGALVCALVLRRQDADSVGDMGVGFGSTWQTSTQVLRARKESAFMRGLRAGAACTIVVR